MNTSNQPLQIPPVYAYFAPMFPSDKFFLWPRDAASLKIIPSERPLVRLTDRNDCSAWAEIHYFEAGQNLEQLYPEARQNLGGILRYYHAWKAELWRRLQERKREMEEQRKQDDGVKKEEEMTNEELEEEEFRRQEPERKALDQKFAEKWKMEQEEERKLKEEENMVIKKEPKEEQG